MHGPIVIVGGGFAGTTLARALERGLPREAQIVLVSEESYTTFNPMLAEVVGASVFPEHVVAPIRQMLARSRFVMGRATHVDLARRELVADTLAGRRAIGFGQLVLAFGSRAALDLVPGMAEHALPLKLVGDALHIRNRVLQRVARIELEHDSALRRRLGRFIVIGGGFSGVEVAGALADFLAAALRWYPRVRRDELQVVLLEAADRLLVELPASLGMAARRSLEARAVVVRLGSRAARIDAEGVTLSDAARLDAASVVCTIGTRANPLAQAVAAAAGLVLERGRIPTAADGSVPGVPGLWAIGDCALVPDATPQRSGCAYAPATAQAAVAQARMLARNLAAARADLPTRPLAFRSRGMMATTGHLKGVAQVGRLRLAGLPAWLLWRAVYLLRMPTLGRKVRIWVEWTWAMAFAADITHLRFTRTPEVDAERTAGLDPTHVPSPPARAAA
jgi:NADH dehydrogenase